MTLFRDNDEFNFPDGEDGSLLIGLFWACVMTLVFAAILYCLFWG